MKLSPSAAIRFGWDTFKKRPWFFVGAMILLTLASFAASFASSFVVVFLSTVLAGLMNSTVVLFVGLGLARVVGIVISVLVFMCTIGFFLAAQDEPETVGLPALWHPRPFWKFVGAYFALMLVFILLCAIPYGLFAVASVQPNQALAWTSIWAALIAVIGAVLFFPWYFVVMDRRLGPIQSLKESLALTKGNRWRIFGFFALSLFIALVCAAAFLLAYFIAQLALDPGVAGVVAAIVAIATFFIVSVVLGIAFANVYRQLAGETAPISPADARLAA